MKILRNAPEFRYAEVRYGDDLRSIALRELGDASKWLDLVLLNELRPPYIAEKAAPGVLAYGDQIKIPVPTSVVSSSSDPDAVFKTDVLVRNKKIVVEDGDLALVSGVANLSQSLARRVVVEKKELAFHPNYGCYVRSLLGRVNGPTAAQLAAFYVKSALLEDDRVKDVPKCMAEVVGDQIKVTAVVYPVSGKPVEMRIVV